LDQDCPAPATGIEKIVSAQRPSTGFTAGSIGPQCLGITS
jgi:hypothetical protein